MNAGCQLLEVFASFCYLIKRHKNWPSVACIYLTTDALEMATWVTRPMLCL